MAVPRRGYPAAPRVYTIHRVLDRLRHIIDKHLRLTINSNISHPALARIDNTESVRDAHITHDLVRAGDLREVRDDADGDVEEARRRKRQRGKGVQRALALLQQAGEIDGGEVVAEAVLGEPVHGGLHGVVGAPGALAVAPAVGYVGVRFAAEALGIGAGKDGHARRAAEFEVADYVFFQAWVAGPVVCTFVLGEFGLLIQAAVSIRG